MPLQKITKEELLLKSISVFTKKGYYRTSMSDLAKACHLTKGAFYHHYESKEAVMMSCLMTTAEIFKKNVFSIAYEENTSPMNRLKKMAEVTYKTFTVENGSCYFANTILETIQIEDTFIEIIKDFFAAWEAAMMKIFTTKYSKKKSKELSIKAIVDIEGSMILMQLHNDTKYLKDSLNRIMKTY